NADGESSYKTITLRELLQYVNDENGSDSDSAIEDFLNPLFQQPTGPKNCSSNNKQHIRRSASSASLLGTPRAARQQEEHREQEPSADGTAADEIYNVIGEPRL